MMFGTKWVENVDNVVSEGQEQFVDIAQDEKD